MTAILFSIISLIIVLKLVSMDLIRRSAKRNLIEWEQNESFPIELRGGEIFLNEAVISCKKPIPLHGKCDQVFKVKKRKLVIVDTKTRKARRVYQSDIVQMSAYKLMLEEKYGKRYEVSGHGYVRVCQVDEDRNEERIAYIRTELLTKKEMVTLYKKHQEIANGQRKANCSCNGLFHK